MAVKDANLEVERGEVVAVIGPNGAGKTTLFRLITGQLRPNGGHVLFKGHEIGGLPAHRVSRRGLSISYQVVNVFARMSVFENVQVAVLTRLGKLKQAVRPGQEGICGRKPWISWPRWGLPTRRTGWRVL